MAETGFTRTKIFLFVPNIIGYLRVVATVGAFWYATHMDGWKLPIILYLAGFAGDVVDGWAARKLNQSSQFGAVLDMVTDRTATAGLVCLNLLKDPKHAFWYITLILLDISSHWFHCFSTAKTGHHKAASTLDKRNILLRIYYGFFPFFAFCCVGQEVFYLANFILLTDSTPLHGPRPAWLRIPESLAKLEAILGLGPKLTIAENILRVVWKVSFVGCVAKQVVNIAQLCSAMGAFADLDVAEYQGKAITPAQKEVMATAGNPAEVTTRVLRSRTKQAESNNKQS